MPKAFHNFDFCILIFGMIYKTNPFCSVAAMSGWATEQPLAAGSQTVFAKTNPFFKTKPIMQNEPNFPLLTAKN